MPRAYIFIRKHFHECLFTAILHYSIVELALGVVFSYLIVVITLITNNMDFNPACLINILLAITALGLYVLGSYRLYKNKKGYLVFLGLAIIIDATTAILASLRITPTSDYFESATVPWYSMLFNVHVTLSMIGFTCFIFLFLYLLLYKRRRYAQWIIKWQFIVILPIWVIGESIALSNAISKLFFKLRIFDLV